MRGHRGERYQRHRGDRAAELGNATQLALIKGATERSARLHTQQRQTGRRQALQNVFSPEFRNRLNAIVTFSQLGEDVVMMVVDKFIKELDVLLAEKKVTIDLSLEAKKWLAEKGYSPQYGARPVARVIQNELKRPLADEILFGKLVEDGHVDVDVEGEGDARKLVMTFTEIERPPTETQSVEPAEA